MPTSSLNGRLLAHLRRVALPRDGGVQTDGQLLGAFVRQHDEAAFAALVKRHGPMVLGVCRRVVGDWHLAEDAFQAVFLVLARRAAVIRPREQVGNWLYGVAYRTARKAQAALLRRRTKEKQVDAMPHAVLTAEDAWTDIRPVLDAELARLPDRLRLPVVLCDLEGRPQREAARQLGLPPATLANRLAAARRQLAKALAGRGVTLSGGAVAMLLTAHAATAAVPSLLVAAVVRTAGVVTAGGAAAGVVPAPVVQLSEEVLRMLLLSKLKTVLGMVLAVAVLAGGLGIRTLSMSWGGPPDANGPKPAPAARASQPGPTLDDREFLHRVSLDLRGVPPTPVEVGYFLADAEPKKRTRVVEWMLRDVNDVANVTGGNDSVWIDVGLPVQAGPSGRRYRTTLAPYVVDLGARLKAASAVQWPEDPVQLNYDNKCIVSYPNVDHLFPDFNGSLNANLVNEVFVEFDDDRQRVSPDPWHVKYRTWVGARPAAQDRVVLFWDVAVSSDEGFLRRACQDARGAAPTAVELEYFKADQDPKKREKLLDLLLKDPAVAKKLGAAWKQQMLQPPMDRFSRVINVSPLVRYYGAWNRVPRTPNRLEQTLDQMLEGKRTDVQVLEALSLALLGRLPTESERHLVLANMSKQPDRKAAWREVMKSLAGTSEAKQHADELNSRR